MSERIKVGVRVRPMLPFEKNSGASFVATALPNGTDIKLLGEQQQHTFDWAWGEKSTNKDVYAAVGYPLIEKLFEGYNATIFAYGQTGSGKTHTMGNTGDDDPGITPRAIEDLFKKKEELQSDTVTVTIEMQYIEIYREECYDLLAVTTSGSRANQALTIRENQKQETILEGLSTRVVESPDHVQELLSEAQSRRVTGATLMNSESSRSHAICSFSIRITSIGVADDVCEMASDETQNNSAVEASNDAGTGSQENVNIANIDKSSVPSDTDNGTAHSQQRKSTLTAKLHLVDLAGSERQKKTQATDDRLQEGISINKGLLVLGNVVTALQQKHMQSSQQQGQGSTKNASHIHVPYRESKLTRLLKDSLGGNGITVLLSCISPSSGNVDETSNTLYFSKRASAIVNAAKVNHDDNALDAAALAMEVGILRTQNQALQVKSSLLQKQLQQAQQSIQPSHGNSNNNNNTLEASSLQRTSSSGSMQLSSSVTSSIKLAGLVRGLLVRCLEEGIEIEDEEVNAIRSDISTIRKDTANSSLVNDEILDKEDVSDDMYVPPLFQLVDEVQQLEKQLQKITNLECNSTNSSGSGSGSGRYSSGIDGVSMCGDAFTRNNEDILAAPTNESDSFSFAGSTNQSSNSDDPGSLLQCKQQEIDGLLTLTTQFEASIEQLKNDIASLTSEKQRLVRLQSSNASSSSSSVGRAGFLGVPKPSFSRGPMGGSSSTSSSSLSGNSDKQQEDLRIKRLLKEKSTALEEKMRELKRKESDLSRLVEQREAAVKQADELKRRVVVVSKAKADMVKKLAESELQHRLEKSKLMQQEMESKRREITAQNALASRERVLKGQLEAKERESAYLRLLIEKQQRIKEMKSSLRSGAPPSAANGIAGSLTTASKPQVTLSSSTVLLPSKVTNSASSRATTCSGSGDALNGSAPVTVQRVAALEGWIRGEVMKARSEAKNQSSSLSNDNNTSVSVTSGSANGNNNSNGVNSSGVVGNPHMPFKNGVPTTNLEEAKVVMSWLFTQLSKRVSASSSKQRVGFASKPRIEANKNTTILPRKPKLPSFNTIPSSTSNSTSNNGSNVVAKPSVKIVKKKFVVPVPVRQPVSLGTLVGDKRKVGEEEEEEGEEEEEEGEEEQDDEDDDEEEEEDSWSVHEADESFYPSADEEEDEDEEEEWARRRNRKRDRRRMNSRTSKSSERKSGGSDSLGSSYDGEGGENENENDSDDTDSHDDDEDEEVSADYFENEGTTSKKGKHTHKNDAPLYERITGKSKAAGSKRQTNRKVEENMQSSMDDDDDNSVGSRSPVRRVNKKMEKDMSRSVPPPSTETLMSFYNVSRPLQKHTVKELKPLLLAHSLPVSGVKDELIRRLEIHCGLSVGREAGAEQFLEDSMRLRANTTESTTDVQSSESAEEVKTSLPPVKLVDTMAASTNGESENVNPQKRRLLDTTVSQRDKFISGCLTPLYLLPVDCDEE